METVKVNGKDNSVLISVNSVGLEKKHGKHYTYVDKCGVSRRHFKLNNILQFLWCTNKEKIKRKDLMKGIKKMAGVKRRQTCYQWIETLKNMGVIETSKLEQLKALSTQRREDFVYRSYTCRNRNEGMDWQLNVNSKLKKRKVGVDALPTKQIETDTNCHSTYYWVNRDKISEIREKIREKETLLKNSMLANKRLK